MWYKINEPKEPKRSQKRRDNVKLQDVGRVLKETRVPAPAATILGGQTDKGKVVFLVIVDDEEHMEGGCWYVKGLLIEEEEIAIPIILIKGETRFYTSFYDVYINLQKKKDLENPKWLILAGFDSNYNLVFSKDLSKFLPSYNKLLNVPTEKTWSDAEFKIAKRRIMEEFSLEQLWEM